MQSRPRLCSDREKAVLRPWQPQIFTQRPALIFAPEEPAPLQFRHHAIDEIVQPLRKIGEHDVEAVAGLADQPLFHLIGDAGRRADKGEAARHRQGAGPTDARSNSPAGRARSPVRARSCRDALVSRYIDLVRRNSRGRRDLPQRPAARPASAKAPTSRFSRLFIRCSFLINATFRSGAKSADFAISIQIAFRQIL